MEVEAKNSGNFKKAKSLDNVCDPRYLSRICSGVSENADFIELSGIGARGDMKRVVPALKR
jgi:hypothetical protein